MEVPGLRREFVAFSIIASIGTAALIAGSSAMPDEIPRWFAVITTVVVAAIIVMGTIDFFQTKHTIRANFPFLGRFRYWFEMIRPEIYQYFIESNSEGVPFNREARSVVYQRSKKQLSWCHLGSKPSNYVRRAWRF